MLISSLLGSFASTRDPPHVNIGMLEQNAKGLSTLCNEAQAPTGEMAVTPPSIKKSAPTTYAESSDAR